MKQAWQDAKDGNWEVCAMNLTSTLQHMREGVKLHPEKATTTHSGKVELALFLSALETGPWPKLQSAARQHDMAAFKPAYVEVANACVACHTAAGRPKICLRLPEEANSPQ
jgi:cytochrome c553